MPSVVFNDDGTVTINDIRDWTYDENGPITYDYISKTYDPSKLKNVYFLMEPFQNGKQSLILLWSLSLKMGIKS